ncbi:MAG: rhombosortase [Desulfobacteraceae bacterium]
MGINDIHSFLFLSHAVGSGQWWRLLTFPFVHVSWYHLVLDVGAFVYLYSSIQQKTFDRLGHVIISGAFSLATACILSPEINDIGLCGLSGIDHGLMAAAALWMIRNKEDRRLGYTFLTLLIAKCVYEMVAGDVFFSSIHLGLCGTPLVACHLGGVVGGTISFFLCRKSDYNTAYSNKIS